MKKDLPEPAPVKEEKDIIPAPSPLTNWLIMGTIFIVLLVAAIGLGLRAEQLFGDNLYQVLPKTLTSKWGGVPPSKPDTLPQPSVSAREPSPKPTSEDQIPQPSNAKEPETTPLPDEEAENAYLLPYSDSRKITETDLADYTPWELKVARNEIYARHGRMFIHQDLACYFTQQSWYTVDPDFSTDTLTNMETNNAAFILNYEQSIKSPLLNKDSGCDRTEN